MRSSYAVIPLPPMSFGLDIFYLLFVIFFYHSLCLKQFFKDFKLNLKYKLLKESPATNELNHRFNLFLNFSLLHLRTSGSQTIALSLNCNSSWNERSAKLRELIYTQTSQTYSALDSFLVIVFTSFYFVWWLNAFRFRTLFERASRSVVMVRQAHFPLFFCAWKIEKRDSFVSYNGNPSAIHQHLQR